MKKGNFSRLLAILIAVLIVAALLPRATTEAATVTEHWTGGNDPSCTHPSEKVRSVGIQPFGGVTHRRYLQCDACYAVMYILEPCSDADNDNHCDVCGALLNCTHPNLQTSHITPGSTGFPNGGTIEYCGDCGYEREIPAGSGSTTPSGPNSSLTTPSDVTNVKHRLLLRYFAVDKQYQSLMPGAYGEMHAKGEHYFVRSPQIEGFTASPASVGGEMPDHSMTLFIYYTKVDPGASASPAPAGVDADSKQEAKPAEQEKPGEENTGAQDKKNEPSAPVSSAPPADQGASSPAPQEGAVETGNPAATQPPARPFEIVQYGSGYAIQTDQPKNSGCCD